MAYEHLGIDREYRDIAGVKDGNGKVTYAHRDGPPGQRFATKAAAKQAWLEHRRATAAATSDHYGYLQAGAALKNHAEQQSAKAGAAAAPKPAAWTGLPSYSKADVDKAVIKARAEERARVRAVFASEASKGRERLCATLLGAPDAWTAQQIVGALPGMPDDRGFAAKLATPAKARADAVWDRANATVAARKQAPAGQASASRGATTASASASVWERANAKLAAKQEAAR